MDVHAAAVVANEGLWHEGRGLAIAVRHVHHDVLQNLNFVALFRERAGSDADFGLAASGDLVMMDLYLQTHFLERKTHRRTDVLECVDRGNGEVTALDAGTVPLVTLLVLGRGIPRSLQGVDGIEAAVHLVAPTDTVENEELILGSEQRVIGDAGGLQVGLGALGQGTRVALVALHRRRFNNVATDIDRRFFEKRIDDAAGRFGHQNHVRLIDALPSGDGRTVEHLAVTEQLVVDELGRNRDVLFLASRIGESEVCELDLFFFYQLQNISGCHIASGKGFCSPVSRPRCHLHGGRPSMPGLYRVERLYSAGRMPAAGHR